MTCDVCGRPTIGTCCDLLTDEEDDEQTDAAFRSVN